MSKYRARSESHGHNHVSDSVILLFRPSPSSSMWASRSASSVNNTTRLVQEDMSSALTSGTFQSGRTLQTRQADVPLPKRTRSPTVPYTGGGFPQNPAIASDGHKRYERYFNI